MCPCVQPYSSRPCSRCCSGGSNEQRRRQAERLAALIDSPPRPEPAAPAGGATDELRKWLELLWFEGFYEGKAGKGIERRDADVAEAVKGIESIPAGAAAVAAEGAGGRQRFDPYEPGSYQIGELGGVWLIARVGGSDANVLRAMFKGLVAAANAKAAAEAARAAAETELDSLRKLTERLVGVPWGRRPSVAECAADDAEGAGNFGTAGALIQFVKEARAALAVTGGNAE